MQHDYDIANQGGVSFRQELNTVLLAILSLNSGPSEPPKITPYMVWTDTSGASAVVKQRNAANDAWIVLFTVGDSLASTAHNHNSSYQATDSTLTTLSGKTISTAALSLLDDGSVPLMRQTLGLGDGGEVNTANNPVVLDSSGRLPGLLLSGSVPVRQTVLSGPVDASGAASFGGVTGSTTVTATGTLVATAANGFSAAGQVDRIGLITNPSWTGLSTNGTVYLYLDIGSDGTCTTGKTMLAPSYQSGGVFNIVSGQFTFNIQEMVGKVGDGSLAGQAYRVFVGECLIVGGVVSTITWYALRGRYDSGYTNTVPAGVLLSKNHNIGVPNSKTSFWVKNLVAAGGYIPGDETDGFMVDMGSFKQLPTYLTRANSVQFMTSAATGYSGSVTHKLTTVPAVVL